MILYVFFDCFLLDFFLRCIIFVFQIIIGVMLILILLVKLVNFNNQFRIDYFYEVVMMLDFDYFLVRLDDIFL